MRKIFVSALTCVFFAVGSAYGQSELTNEQMVDEMMAYGEEDAEEIDNYDFLYNGNDAELRRADD